MTGELVTVNSSTKKRSGAGQLCPGEAAGCPQALLWCGLNDSTFLAGFLQGLSESIGKKLLEKKPNVSY